MSVLLTFFLFEANLLLGSSSVVPLKFAPKRHQKFGKVRWKWIPFRNQKLPESDEVKASRSGCKPGVTGRMRASVRARKQEGWHSRRHQSLPACEQTATQAPVQGSRRDRSKNERIEIKFALC
jgi:hypothetical protein